MAKPESQSSASEQTDGSIDRSGGGPPAARATHALVQGAIGIDPNSRYAQERKAELQAAQQTIKDPNASAFEKLLAYVNIISTLAGGDLPGPGVISAGGKAAIAGARVAAPKALKALPVLDRTGKVHGALPKASELGRYSVDDLTRLQTEPRQSVQERIRRTIQLGSDKAHGQRQAAEQELIRQIEKHLEDRR